ncbi:MAG: restriction endonuclease subunit S [Oscillospiraceae bacterium]|jgi:type I restriction enzyme S subunit
MIEKTVLPSGWVIKPMTEVVTWGSGGTPKATESQYYKSGDIPWLIIGDLNDGVVTKSQSKITKLGLQNSSAKMIPAGTLMVAMYGSIGKLGITGIECCTNQAIAFAKELHGVSTKYMFYYMAMMKSKLISMGKGGTQNNISQTILKSLNVIVPPPEVQDNLVFRIEELFSELDKAVETLQTTKQQLAVYRQAVLKEAFANITSKKPLREITSIVTSGSRGWAKYYADFGARFIRITDLTRDCIVLKNDNIQYVSLPENVEGTRSRLYPNDVLISITADLGSIALVPNGIEEAYINQHIALVRFINTVQGEYMAWYLKSEWGQKDLLKNKRGGGKLGLGLDDIRNTPVPIVSNETAKATLEGIESRLSVCESIEQIVDTALAQADAMRQSILKQAFEGRL